MNDIRTTQLVAELDDIRGSTVSRGEHDRVLGLLAVERDRTRHAEGGARARIEQLAEMRSIIVDLDAWARHLVVAAVLAENDYPPELRERVRLLLERT